MSKWLEILGFGAQKERTGSSPDVARKAARIRETMRWRGFDLSAYSDEEIVVESDRLGGGVSETGETTEASREALAAALRERRASGEPAVHRAADVTPPSPETREPEIAPEAARETPAQPRPPAPGRSARRPRPRATSAPAGPDARTPLVRLRHIFGIHSWRLAEGPEGAQLRCPGCRQERAIGRGPAPVFFPREEPAEDAILPEPEPPPAEAPEEPLPARASRERRGDATPGLLRWLLASPWWVKMLAIFATFQVIGVITSLFRS